MKNVFLITCIVAALVACNQNAVKNNSNADSTKMAGSGDANAKMDYPYTVDKIPDWRPGDPQNAVNALKALKAYENKNMAECVSYFGDSVHFLAEKFDAHLSNDSLKAMFLKDVADGNSVKIKMNDWESVKSKDGTEQWVSMWYKQITTDKTGKVDSVEIMDDLKFKNGKIVILDEKSRHYAVPNKM